MDAVILFSHGSVLCGAGEALEAHAARLRTQGLAPLVEIGYLNYSEPSFLEAVTRCVSAGATRIIVAPYFLVPGYFVKVDLPKAVRAAMQTHPETTFLVAEALGFDAALADALIESARQAAPPEAWRDDLRRAADHCRENLQCPLYGTPDCPASPPLPAGGLTPGAQRRTPNAGAQRLNARRVEPGVKALLVLVHGSPHASANADMYRVVDLIRQRGIFPIVEVGFLECNAPAIPDAIDTCVAQGATRILAVPYFLHTGKHVADDLPTMLEEGSNRHPGIEYRLGDYLGRSERLTDILAARMRAVL